MSAAVIKPDVLTMRQWRKELANEQPVSEQRVALSPAVVAAFACPDCRADVIIPRVIRLHDPTCITQRRQ